MIRKLVQLLFSLILASIVFLLVGQSAHASPTTALLDIASPLPFTITNAEGQYVTFDDNNPQGTGTMQIVSLQLAGEGTRHRIITVPTSSSFTYSYQGGQTNAVQYITIANGPNFYANMLFTNVNSVTVGNAGGETAVSFSGNDMTYNASIWVQNNGSGVVGLTGKGSGTVTMKDTKQGVKITGTSGLCTLSSNYGPDAAYKEKSVDFIRTADTVVASNFTPDSFEVTGADIIPKPKPVTVTFNSKGGTPVAKQELSITFDKDNTATYPQAAKPADPTKKGYTFEGWFTKEGKQWDFASEVKENLTLYAHWKADSPKVDQPDGGGLPPSGDVGAWLLPAGMLLGLGAFGIFGLKWRNERSI